MRILNLHHGAFVPTFRKLGHEVLSIGTTPESDVALAEPLSHKRLLDLLADRGFRPDLAFWCDACQVPWIFGLESLAAVVIGYSVDQYVNPWHVPYSAGFDAVFVAQKDYLPLFATPETPRPAAWLPLFCDPARSPAPDGPRDIPVSFVGTVGDTVNADRKPFLDAFRTHAPLVVTRGAYGPIYGRSRLVLNQSAAGELNFRIFEAMACGAALLTEDVGNGLAELFTPGEDPVRLPPGRPGRRGRAGAGRPGRSRPAGPGGGGRPAQDPGRAYGDRPGPAYPGTRPAGWPTPGRCADAWPGWPGCGRPWAKPISFSPPTRPCPCPRTSGSSSWNKRTPCARPASPSVPGRALLGEGHQLIRCPVGRMARPGRLLLQPQVAHGLLQGPRRPLPLPHGGDQIGGDGLGRLGGYQPFGGEHGPGPGDQKRGGQAG